VSGLSTSLIPSVLDTLVAQFTTALAGVMAVTDGPPTVDIPASGLFVGAALGDEAIQFQQANPVAGARRRDEQFDIPNLMYLRTGDTDTLSATRASVFAALALLETSMRADMSIGIAGNSVRAQLGTVGWFSQVQSPDGIVCRISFTIEVKTRI
jgi:hypothetical protein